MYCTSQRFELHIRFAHDVGLGKLEVVVRKPIKRTPEFFSIPEEQGETFAVTRSRVRIMSSKLGGPGLPANFAWPEPPQETVKYLIPFEFEKTVNPTFEEAPGQVH